jgi:F-type H+-transporting ATPase subunit delta
VALLLSKKPHGYVGILSRLHRLVKLDLEQRAARVESALPLPTDLQTDVTNQIRKIYGTGADITFGRNPALIGGLRIQVGSDLYDGSVRTRLDRLEQSF